MSGGFSAGLRSPPATAGRPLHNLIGPFVARLRSKRGWTQDQLVARLQVAGFDITRDVLVNIELRRTAARDLHAIGFARVFKIPIGDLFPQDPTAVDASKLATRVRRQRRDRRHTRRRRRPASQRVRRPRGR